MNLWQKWTTTFRHGQALLLLVIGLGGSSVMASADGVRHTLEYAPAPVENPLKGLVPYAADVRDRFPHSMEFNYLPLSALLVGPEQYDWKPLEKLLDEIASRGHQAVFRIYLEYPGKKNVIPAFLIQQGVKVHRYLNTNTQPFPPKEVETPDYTDPKLRAALQAFIRALGKRYDGDPRIGFITAGLLGTWGEWHTYPRNDLFPGKPVQQEIMDAYEAAFHKTPVLLRYPAGDNDAAYAPNHRRRFGYHDDSFAWATLDTGKKADDWFYLPSLRRAGTEAQSKWKTCPIGGEIRPEAWGVVFDENPGKAEIQNFQQCAEQTHVTWLMDSGMFQKQQPEARKKRAREQVRRMGYEFHIPAVTIESAPNGRLQVRVELVNRGIAPFYYDWPHEYALLTREGRILRTFTGRGKLTGLLPGAPARLWAEEFNIETLPSGSYKLLLRVPNPLPNGKPLRFANATQDADLAGWLTLHDSIPAGNISVNREKK